MTIQKDTPRFLKPKANLAEDIAEYIRVRKPKTIARVRKGLMDCKVVWKEEGDLSFKELSPDHPVYKEALDNMEEFKAKKAVKKAAAKAEAAKVDAKKGSSDEKMVLD